METMQETKQERIQSYGYAAYHPKAKLMPFRFERRSPGPKDVVIEIMYCGICHSDIHQVNDDWGRSVFPMVPWHEISGKVIEVGSAVRKFRIGDAAGVGCMVDSCRNCDGCKAGEEQFCDRGPTWTYGAAEKHIGGPTYGGYSNNIVVDEDFVLRIPKGLDLAKAAPLLCAGITTYSPLKHWKVSKGQKVGVIGLGGLGHMALKLANSFGAHVVQFTTSSNKIDDAKRLGAHDVVLSTDSSAMASHAASFDFILDTVSADHDVNAYLALLKRNGSLVLVGLPSSLPVMPFSLVGRRRSFSGSLIGGIKETQEMLDYCAANNITPEIEVVHAEKINEAYERTIKADVKYRFVIDISTLMKA